MEFVKHLGLSVVLALVLVVVVNVIGDFALTHRPLLPETSVVEEDENKPAKSAAVEEEPEAAEESDEPGLAARLAAYDPEAGKKAFRKCKSCHTSGKDDGNRVGPNLWDVVGRAKGTVEGFRYSDAMINKGGAWTYEDLDAFLINPRTFIMGTKMSVKGYKDPALRATLIGYLRSLSDAPKALPE